MTTDVTGPLRAGSWLAANAGPMLDGAADRLRAAGLAVSVLTSSGRNSTELDDLTRCDLVWMCGALAADLSEGRGAASGFDHEVVAAPVFAGEQAPVYRSVIVTRADGPTTVAQALAPESEMVLAMNEYQSWSGHRALRRHLGDRWFGRELVTGSHASSIAALCDRRADVAAIDHTVWAWVVQRDTQAAGALRVIDQTVDWPAPPFLVGRSVDALTRERLVRALLAVTEVPGVPGIARIVSATNERYAPMREDGA